jgi:electron-transferring-flavoprotein dehydrogenase
MKTGILAAEAAHEALSSMENPNMDAYWEALQHSWVWQELYSVRNIRPFFHHGLLPGLVHAGLDHYVIRGRLPYTLAHGPPDHECTEVQRWSHEHFRFSGFQNQSCMVR